MTTLKTAIIVIVIVLFSSLQILISLAKFQKTQWLPNNLQVTDDGGNIAVRNIYSQGYLISLAPYQDFVYFQGPQGKTSLKSAFISAQNQPWTTKVLTFLLPPTQWTWRLQNPNIVYSYKLTYDQTDIKLVRTVQSKTPVEEIGQVIQFCPTCIIENVRVVGKITIQNTQDGSSASIIIPTQSRVYVYPGNTLEVVSPVAAPQIIQFASL